MGGGIFWVPGGMLKLFMGRWGWVGYILGGWGWVGIFYGLVRVSGGGWSYILHGCGWRYILGGWGWVAIFYGSVVMGGGE